MDIKEFILTEQRSLSLLTSKVREEEEKKTMMWRIHDQSDSDEHFDESQLDCWMEDLTKISCPKVCDLPKDYSFRSYQEYCFLGG